jgi:RNA recognition motif-containing protein
MGTKIYVGNLNFDTSSNDLEAIFSPHGAVVEASVVTDRDTGRSRGFGFVQMESDADAAAAIEAENGKEHGGRTLTVNEAKPRERSGGGGGGGFRGGNRGGGGGRRY